MDRNPAEEDLAACYFTVKPDLAESHVSVATDVQMYLAAAAQTKHRRRLSATSLLSSAAPLTPAAAFSKNRFMFEAGSHDCGSFFVFF